MSSEIPPPPKERFRDTSIGLAHYCKNIIVKAYHQKLTQITPGFVKLGLMYLEEEYTPEDLIEGFILYSYPSWEQIKQKDERFFDENMGKVFRYYKPEILSMFRELFFIKLLNYYGSTA